MFRSNKQSGSDMADVLLSLKDAVVHPGQSPTEKYETQHVYHPQMLLSPGGYSGGFCEQTFSQQPPLFPSMSVNVSMNMTMHGYHPNNGCGYSAADIACPQVSCYGIGSTPHNNRYLLDIQFMHNSRRNNSGSNLYILRISLTGHPLDI